MMEPASDQAIAEALRWEMTVDISTLGRRSGEWRRIEIWFHNIGGRIYLTGIPRPRGWYANILHHREMIFHLKQSIAADLKARGRPVTDLAERREVLGSRAMSWYHRRSDSGEAFIADAPLVEVVFADTPRQGKNGTVAGLSEQGHCDVDQQSVPQSGWLADGGADTME